MNLAADSQVLERVVAWARREDAVRTMLLGGSRAACPERVDALSDYDVVLFLRDPGTLAADAGWTERFGKVLVELPERFDLPWQEIETRLVQYRDGTKVDFSLSSTEDLERIVREGALPDWLDAGYEILVDKDGVASELPPPSGEAHVPDRPGPEEFEALAQELWWETLYVAKHLVRGELLAARYSLESVIRYELLVPALEWLVQVDRGWSQPVAPHGRGPESLLPAEIRDGLEATMPGPGRSAHWHALRVATRVFRTVMQSVAADLEASYPADLDRDISERLEELRRRDVESG
ncbi:MAG: aminoglycoside 6-adenylyltransferase [Gemmatimonadota bacterium]